MLASFGIPLVIDLIGKLFEKGMQIGRPPCSLPPSPPPPPPRGKGMHVRPPPFVSSWDDYEKK